MKKYIWLNGKLLAEDRLKISPWERGFLYGEGIFETLRVYGGSCPFLEEHLQRLNSSATFLKILFPFTGIEEAVKEVIKKNRVREGVLRIILSQGEEKSRLYILVREGIPYPEEIYRRGMKGVFSSFRRNPFSPLSRIKSLSYLENILAQKEAKKRGGDEAIFLNTEGMVAEGSTSNIFLVKKDKVITPSLETGILPGITRQKILELLPSLRIEGEERKVRVQEMEEAEEIFLTSSLKEVMPLVEIEGKPVGKGLPGPLTQRLRLLYQELLHTRQKAQRP